jgi:retron-type reverse transcriptase
MIEAIVDIRNINYAQKQVCSNKGASGVDGMQTDELRDFMSTHWQTFKEALLLETYQPSAVRQVEIPKPQDGTLSLLLSNIILHQLDELLRSRVRKLFWQKWQKTKTKMRNLIKLGVSKWRAYQWANTSKGACSMAHSPILLKSLNNEVLAK